MRRLLLLFFAATAATTMAHPQSDPTSRAWNEPVEPFRIAANLYYVGAAEVTSYLVTTPQGHIVLDGGFAETAPQIARNIEKLGFRLRDVKILLSSHAHYDHAGGLAELQRVTGARLLAHPLEIPQLARGGLDDPQFANRFPFPPVYADSIIRDGAHVRLGGADLVAHLTPGHTRGCTSWTMTLRDRTRKLDVVFLCSPSVPAGYQTGRQPALSRRRRRLPRAVRLSALAASRHLSRRARQLLRSREEEEDEAVHRPRRLRAFRRHDGTALRERGRAAVAGTVERAGDYEQRQSRNRIAATVICSAANFC
ncbi:MAG TPA: subclass B3 metallo-beta-lactamase [Thermoanaerobaculia bacterium]